MGGNIAATKAGMGERAAGGVRWRTVALPNEHGGWGITLEPVALGLAVAPSWAGLLLSLATLAAFLARHPLKIAAADRRRGRRFARTQVAERFALLYGAAAALLFSAAVLSGPNALLIPLAAALPLAAAQLSHDCAGRGRALLPESAGSAAMSAAAASIALAGGLTLAHALGLWAVLAARVVPTILYVRARLRVNRGERPSNAPVLLAHAAAVAFACALAWAGHVPAIGAAVIALLFARAAHGLRGARTIRAKTLGISEVVYGALVVAAVAVGHHAGL